jgi:hypothetical protein
VIPLLVLAWAGLIAMQIKQSPPGLRKGRSAESEIFGGFATFCVCSSREQLGLDEPEGSPLYFECLGYSLTRARSGRCERLLNPAEPGQRSDGSPTKLRDKALLWQVATTFAQWWSGYANGNSRSTARNEFRGTIKQGLEPIVGLRAIFACSQEVDTNAIRTALHKSGPITL